MGEYLENSTSMSDAITDSGPQRRHSRACDLKIQPLGASFTSDKGQADSLVSFHVFSVVWIIFSKPIFFKLVNSVVLAGQVVI